MLKILENVTRKEACSGHCSFDSNSPCHFYVYDDSNTTCYMGNFFTESQIQGIQMENAIVHSSTIRGTENNPKLWEEKS